MADSARENGSSVTVETFRAPPEGEPTTTYTHTTTTFVVEPRVDGAHGGPVGSATTQELIGRIINDLSALLDKQIELAKQEVREDLAKLLDAAKMLGIAAGIAAAAGLLAVIWLWTAVIWFFNWLGDLIFGDWGSWIGWLVGIAVPLIAVYVAYQKFAKPGIEKAKRIRPMVRTRTTLKEDLEWVQQLRTPNAR